MKPTYKEVANEILNPQQELFCHLFARDNSFIGNAARAYAEAYGLSKKQYGSAIRSASRLLINVDIKKRVNELLDECLENRVVDRELAKAILQNENLHAKVAAIKEYNRLRDRAADRLEGSFVFSWQGDETL
jgi:phage terminase small subunit